MNLRRFFKGGRKPDYFLLAIVFLLVVGGLAALTSASSDLGELKFGDSYYYLKHQLVSGLLFGAIGFLGGYLIPYQKYKKLSFFFLLANMLLLVLVFTPFGVRSGGATRWLSIGPATFQPAEFLKLTFIIYLAAWFANTKTNRAKDVTEGLLPFLVISGITAALLLAQPATSTVVILMAAGGVIYFLSGAEWKHMLGIMGICALGLAVIIVATPYRLSRVKGFLNKNSDSQGTNYHLNQALIALGSGGVFGMGFGQSTAKVSHLPEVIDDSIFAVVGQELGFVGAGALVALFGILVFRMFWLAKGIRDRFGRLMLIGFGTIIAFQSIVNIGAISGLLPLTGVPLPFVSYGGTALAVFLTIAGISANISKYS